jgi:hypothetical protein
MVALPRNLNHTLTHFYSTYVYVCKVICINYLQVTLRSVTNIRKGNIRPSNEHDSQPPASRSLPHKLCPLLFINITPLIAHIPLMKQEILLVRKELQMFNRILLALIYCYSVFNKCVCFDTICVFVTPPLHITLYGNKRTRF